MSLNHACADFLRTLANDIWAPTALPPGKGAIIVAIGVAAGAAGATALTRYLEGTLYGLTALDVTTFAVVAAAFATVAMLAAYLPARRATAIDPLAALRQD